MCFNIKTKMLYKFVRSVIHLQTIFITVCCHLTATEVPNAAELAGTFQLSKYTAALKSE